VEDLKPHHTIEYEGTNLAVIIKRNALARRMVLRPWQSHGESLDGAIVTIPCGFNDRDALKFVRLKAGWIIEKLSNLPKLIKLEDGVEIPYLGITHKIIHEPSAKRGVWREYPVIHVSGKAEFLSRRLQSWFKSEAKKLITKRAKSKSDKIHREICKITIRDPRSRWGSCSRNGKLSFSWRLIMAPEFVFDYVVAHEIAHLEEPNHGAKFWALTNKLCQDTKEAKNWLRINGSFLHRYY